MRSRYILWVIACILLAISNVSAQTREDKSSVSYLNGAGRFPLAANGRVAPLCVADSDFAGVVLAVKSLQTDIQKVTTQLPQLLNDNVKAKKLVVLIGTIGKSPIIDRLIKDKKLDVSEIRGKWEAHITQVITHPMPGTDKALVIAGSDKRGTIYGVYELSAQIGVSPWYWWADVPVAEHKNLYFLPGKHIDGGPAVKYRGIFINDEAPSFSGWANEKFGGVNHQLYTKMFELILRLKGNYLWPAMWNNAFNDDDKLDPILADEYGVVMGTSHHEPMDRAQQEWKRYGTGPWDYQVNGAVLRDFWKKGIEHMGKKETIVTIGMRGDGDKPMTEGSNIKLLEQIVHDQRRIIAEATGKDTAQTPQMWALYKEVQDYYDKGMRVPDDVTLLLCDDNWGNIRKLPKLGEPERKGGYGIYYHFDYVGDPRNYKWLNTNPISKTWEQLHLANEYGAKQVWIVNVGDLKPMEFPISFFMDYAWAPDKWPAAHLDEYTRLWATQQFGQQYAAEIAQILTQYTKYNGRRKPELLNQDTYSLINYREFENVVNDYDALLKKARLVYKNIPQKYKDAYYQLVLHPVEACANLNELYFNDAKNKLYAAQGRSATNATAGMVKQLFKNDSAISHYYNKVMANGKWDHMMDQTHISYTYWQQPPVDKMPEVAHIDLPAQPQMGVAIEGSEKWWPQERSAAVLPAFYPNTEGHFIEIFNRGQGTFKYKLTTPASYIHIQPNADAVASQQRVWLAVDWQHAPKGKSLVPITISDGQGHEVSVDAILNNTPFKYAGFYENNGYVAIEAQHYTKAIGNKDAGWQLIPDYGRTLSGMMPSPVTMKKQTIAVNSPRLEYDFNIADTGMVKITAYLSPTIDFTNSTGLHYGISVDDEQPQVININADKTESTWRNQVSQNINTQTSLHRIKTAGHHVLKYWMIDPAVVLEKLVIDAGGAKPSYLGPPESFHK